MIDFDAGGKWEGLDGLAEELLEELRPKAEAAVKAAAVFFEGAIKERLSGQRSGRLYVVSRTGLEHQASAPGEPPGVLFGNLRNSIGHSEPKWEEKWTVASEVVVGLGKKPADGQDPETSYARRLEFGGVHTVARRVAVPVPGGWITVKAGTTIRILPRPYLEPTRLVVEPIIERMFEEAL
jgi:hypothetical protein